MSLGLDYLQQEDLNSARLSRLFTLWVIYIELLGIEGMPIKQNWPPSMLYLLLYLQTGGLINMLRRLIRYDSKPTN